ncbi:MAG: hypothetical protein IK086_01185, partial [Clostridia bacterium]|nr:hypothetical protein [Clostridia bacterium]
CSIDSDVRNAAAEFMTSGKGVSVNNGIIDIGNGGDTKDDNEDNGGAGSEAVDPITGEVIDDDTDNNNTGTGDTKDNNTGTSDNGGNADNGGTDNGEGSGNTDNGGSGSQDLSGSSDFGPIIEF